VIWRGESAPGTKENFSPRVGDHRALSRPRLNNPPRQLFGLGSDRREAPHLSQRRCRHADLIDRARAGFELAVRVVVVFLPGESEARYASRSEVKERRAEAQVEPGLPAGVLYAIGKSDPKWPAARFLERPECSAASIVGYEKSEVVESVSWTAAN